MLSGLGKLIVTQLVLLKVVINKVKLKIKGVLEEC